MMTTNMTNKNLQKHYSSRLSTLSIRVHRPNLLFLTCCSSTVMISLLINYLHVASNDRALSAYIVYVSFETHLFN